MGMLVDNEALSEDQCARLAELIALKLRPGDVLALFGDLGGGKTTFARNLIRALAGDVEHEVASPTFPILLTYDTLRLPVAHFDWYRISLPDEVDELGLGELAESHVVVIEWPEQALAKLPENRIEIHFSEQAESDLVRLVRAEAKGSAAFQERFARVALLVGAIDAFVQAGSNRVEQIAHLKGDASTRAYARLTCADGQRAIMMDAPAAADGPVLSGGKSYSQLAKLAETVVPFVEIDQALRGVGLAAPEIFFADADRGILILEDFGTDGFDTLVRSGRGEPQATLWQAAVDVLIELRKASSNTANSSNAVSDRTLPALDRAILRNETQLLTAWAWPGLKGSEAATPREAIAEFDAAWQPLFEVVLADADGWMLRDYHSPNLMWRADQTGLARVGLLDFQDALSGPWAYDLVSLLQDARVDVSDALESEMLAYYEQAISTFDAEFNASAFRATYALLGAQRATKIIGIFHRLNLRDGKPAYLAHLPRVQAALVKNLRHPDLASLQDWFLNWLPELCSSPPT